MIFGRFEPIVARYDSPQFQRAFKMGFWWTKKGQNWIKNAFFQNNNWTVWGE